MELRKRNREIDGEEAMQSMTDIIFILLMFFLMTSTLVHPSALPLSLPASSTSSSKPVLNERLPQIGVTESGEFILDGRTTAIEAIKTELERNLKTKKDVKIIVAPDRKAPIEKVVQILDFAQVKNIQTILAADNELD